MPEETEQPSADPQEEPGNKEGGGSERQLQRETEQEAWLQDGLEGEAPGVQ
jgi:hypothetical protein